MNITSFKAIGMLSLCLSMACQSAEAPRAPEEDVPKVPVPELPEVPTLPPPPYPIIYDDGSYSIYGLRRRMRNTMDSNVEVTAYIAKVYQPPKCEKKNKDECPQVAAPHIWLTDSLSNADETKHMIAVGYADNEAQIRRSKRFRFEAGSHLRIKGRFTRISASGFNSSNGLIEYEDHSILKE